MVIRHDSGDQNKRDIFLDHVRAVSNQSLWIFPQEKLPVQVSYDCWNQSRHARYSAVITFIQTINPKRKLHLNSVFGMFWEEMKKIHDKFCACLANVCASHLCTHAHTYTYVLNAQDRVCSFLLVQIILGALSQMIWWCFARGKGRHHEASRREVGKKRKKRTGVGDEGWIGTEERLFPSENLLWVIRLFRGPIECVALLHHFAVWSP